MREHKLKDPCLAHFWLSREEKRKAIEKLNSTPHTLSDFLRACVRELNRRRIHISDPRLEKLTGAKEKGIISLTNPLSKN